MSTFNHQPSFIYHTEVGGLQIKNLIVPVTLQKKHDSLKFLKNG